MSTFSPALLELLADPETHEPLRLADEAELSALREAVRAGRARRHSGQPATLEFEGALLAPSRKVAYVIDGGIPNLLIDDRLELSSAL
jgi:uncharacterized protein YbaR (Trm112 family)